MRTLDLFRLESAVPGTEGAVPATYHTVEPSVFVEVISAPDTYLLDVRHNDEFNEGHINGASNLDVTDPFFKAEALKVIPHDKTIAVYCRSGKRSAMASDILSCCGFKVVNLEGGIINWTVKGYPVVHS